MVSDHKNSHLEILRSSVSAFVYPLQYGAGLVADLPREISAIMVSRRDLMEENERLREERLHMHFKLQQAATMEGEIRRLKALLGSPAEFHERALIAELVAVELEPLRRQVIINKGMTHGVFNGQPVIDASGIMGQVIHVAPFSSTVLLLTDPEHSIPALVNRSGLRSIAVGLGRDDAVSLEYIPVNADIKEGDLIVSSGLGRRFPRGYPVGTVSNVTRVPGDPFSSVFITPSAAFGTAQEVLLLWPNQPATATSDLETGH